MLIRNRLPERLALRVNLNDRLRVDDDSGRRTTGRLTHLTADEMALIHKTTIVYPEPEKRTSIMPAISRGAVGVWVSRRW